MGRHKITHGASREQMIDAALRLAITEGWENVTRDAVAIEIDCAPALIPYKVGSMKDYRDLIMRRAVETNCLAVIAQGLVRLHPACQVLPKEIKQAALRPFGL